MNNCSEVKDSPNSVCLQTSGFIAPPSDLYNQLILNT